jgi:penicillin amidase
MGTIMRRRLLRTLLWSVALLVVLAAGGTLWARSQLRSSLPLLDGRLSQHGLSAPVTVARDALGIATVKGSSRTDVAWATGFVHAQDRYFQMDLARRRAAGELAALVGPAALDLDREIRIHRFRAEAHRAVALLAPADRALLDAYVAGVNGGLHALAAAPFEYLVLGQQPQPWRAEDSLLVVLSMFITLQDNRGAYEGTLATMHDLLPAAMVDFLAPRGTEWDAPVIGDAFAVPPIPGPEVYDLRSRRAIKGGIELPPPDTSEVALNRDTAAGGVLGSNNFAVAGRLTTNGAALVANDMHLQIRVPNTWYRAVLQWPDPGNPAEPHRLIGMTLPGVSTLVIGSNTHVAWGFTNTYADWNDIVLLDVEAGRPDLYRTPDGWRRFDHFDETIEIAGRAAEHDDVLWTVWGPVLPRDHAGRARAYAWVAHSAERLAASYLPLESATTIEQAFDAVNGLGTPGQNMVAADQSGRIGWSVFGAIPRRAGIDGQLPASWADGTRGWNGWLDTAEYPRLIDPPGGRLWTANARVVDGSMLAVLGDGSYEVGSRAHAIRARLIDRDHFSARDLLNIQLDTRADFLARWRELLLRTLTPAVVAGQPARAELRDIVEHDWSGEAAPDSAAYRLTRAFREEVFDLVTSFVLADCYEADPAFDYRLVRRREGPIWTLVTGQPYHLLDPAYRSWNELLVDGVDRMIEQVQRDRSGSLRDRVWSEYNVTRYRHPLAAALPLFGRWLNMPAQALPGDLYTPNMHWGASGPSERMVVSPGHESDGIMEMPVGQSGHPLSPYYSNSHPAWVNGEATPFLPGPTEHTLTLTP